jgi:Cu/Ag efflux protein CusF
MKTTLLVSTIISLLVFCGCDGGSPSNVNSATPKPTVTSASATPVPTASVPRDGDYNAKGVVTKINLELASIELDHEDIPGLMPPMRMEFFVTDKKLLDGLKVGDSVDFIIRYKHPTETIVRITQSK